MRYPEFLKEKGTIGYVAPSFGVTGQPYTDQYFEAKRKFEEMGYTVVEGPNVHKMEKVASASAKERAKEFMDMYLDESIDFINSIAGGEIMVDMLPYIDFNKLIYAKPKFFMGYSDNTNMTFLLNTICDVASIYGSNAENFGMKKWYRSLRESYEIMTGKRLHQTSYKKFAINDKSHEEGKSLCGYDLTEPDIIYTSTGEDMKLKGRLIGGCMEVLPVLIGTPYDQVAEYGERYSKDGLLFFLESCEFPSVGVYRTLFQMKEAGWFDHCNGIIFGREGNREPFFEYTFEEACHAVLDEMNIPFIYEADFGHVPPSWSIISGSIGTIEVKDAKAKIKYQLK